MKKKSRRTKRDPNSDRDSFFNKPANKQQSFFNSIQPKLDVSEPGDPYEKQADAVAQKVVSNPADKAVQRQGQEEETQAKLQRQGEEEEMQAKLQRQEEEENQAKLQRQEEEETQAKLQRQEEEEVQAKLQTKEEEEVQTKIQRKREATVPDTDFETRLAGTKSGGSPLPKDVMEEMEQKMNASFKKVRIHTGEEAQWLCEEINAQAFTRGNHIYFNKGKFQPDTTQGKFLLAHELAHVLQQRS